MTTHPFLSGVKFEAAYFAKFKCACSFSGITSVPGRKEGNLISFTSPIFLVKFLSGVLCPLYLLLANNYLSTKTLSCCIKTTCLDFRLFHFKWVLHLGLLPPKSSKISMFWTLSQNYQHLFEKIIYASNSKLSKKLKEHQN